MALNKKPYKGCRDFFPWDMRERNYLFDKMRSSAESFAYEPYDGPLLEEVELYKAKSGEELINDQIYSFTDRGNRNVAIRPEMTPTLARMVANIHKQESKPLRWYAIPNLMRYEKPQRGRVREHWQFNVDIFGGAPILAEIEILSLALHYMKSLGATKEMFKILINDRSIVDALFSNVLKLDEPTAYKLYKIIDNAKKITPEKLSLAINEHLSDSNSQKVLHTYLEIRSFEQLESFLEQHKLVDSCQEFYTFSKMIKELELKDYVDYDPTIVRGLDYYTGIVFEIFDNHPDNRRAIAGGGAYANLLSIFNESPLAGVGFGLGDVTMRDFLVSHNLLPDLKKASFDFMLFYTNADEEMSALKLASELRSKGLTCELNLGVIKFNKIFKLAENKNYSKIGVIENKKLQIKDIKSRDSIEIDLEETQSILDHLGKE